MTPLDASGLCSVGLDTHSLRQQPTENTKPDEKAGLC